MALGPHPECLDLKEPWTTRLLPAAGIALAMVFLGAAVVRTQEHFRREWRRQLADREGQIVGSMLERQLTAGSNGRAADPLLAILEASTEPELPGISAVHLLQPDGTLFATLLGSGQARVPVAGELDALAAGRTLSRFHSLADSRPVLEVITPLRIGEGRDPVGWVEFVLDGGGLEREYRELDARLARQSWMTFGIAGGAMAVVLAATFGRLAATNRLLRNRTQQLLQANRDLALAARTSAVGAVASHLVHGLKNPVAALQQFLSVAPGGGATATPTEWSDATATARRMKSMIDEIVRVLRDEDALASYELSARELVELLDRRIRRLAEARQVRLVLECPVSVSLINRDANLVVLILENLLVNAIQATPEGAGVECRVRAEGGVLMWTVRDEGPGLPGEVREHLFAPVRSQKPGGTGLGLAISRQLASHLGGQLELESSSGAGTTFRLRLPLRTEAAEDGVGTGSPAPEAH